MTFSNSIKICISQKYVSFDGRASRSEYWFFRLFYIICFLFSIFFITPFATPVTFLIFFLPNLAVAVRRLHDVGWGGYWAILGFIPPVSLILTVLFCFKGQTGANSFGPDPLAPPKEITEIFR